MKSENGTVEMADDDHKKAFEGLEIPGAEEEAPAPNAISGLNIPAVYANHFHILTNEQITRLTFGEIVVGNDLCYNTSIVMTTGGAEEFALRILDLISSNREKSAENRKKAN